MTASFIFLVLCIWIHFLRQGHWLAGLMLCLVPFVFGCSPSCLTQADAKAASSYVTECEGYEDTRVCPEGDRIDEQHARDYQECKR